MPHFPRFLLAIATSLEYPCFLDSRAYIDLRLIAGFPALFVDLRDQASISHVFYPGSSASSISRVFPAGAIIVFFFVTRLELSLSWSAHLSSAYTHLFGFKTDIG